MFEDKTHRYAPTTVIKVVGAKGYDCPVASYVAHPPHAHPTTCPLTQDCTALELKTELGSRWFGCERAYINAELRMVIVGTNPRDEVRMRWEAVPSNLTDGQP